MEALYFGLGHRRDAQPKSLHKDDFGADEIYFPNQR